MVKTIQEIIDLIRGLLGKEPLYPEPIPIPKPEPPKPKPKPPTPKPKPDSPYFDFFGKREFLVGASYFDGIRAKYLEQDLDYLVSKGVRLIRLYLNFSLPKNRPWDFLFRSDGSLHPNKLGALGHILQLTRKREMVVDISSSRRLDGVDGKSDGWQMPPKVYVHCWHLLAKQLKAWGFEHFLIDVENEHNNPWAGQSATMTISEAIYVRSVIQVHLPNVPISASVASHISPEAAATMARQEGMNSIYFHDPRDPGSAKNTEALALRCKKAAGSKIPIYFQEPAHIGQFVKSSSALINMCKGAKRAGIAAWCMHQINASFTLTERTFESRLDPRERGFFDRLGEII